MSLTAGDEGYLGLTRSRWERLSGCSFWVTGAGTGYGRSIARALARAGARVFLTGRRIEKLDRALDGVQSEAAAASLVVPADLTDPAGVEAAIGKIRAVSSSLDGIVHCAALPPPAGHDAPLLQMDPAHWADLVATNVTAPWLVVRGAWPLLLRSLAPRIILFTSEAGWAVTPGVGPYNVTKAALNNLGASLAAELAAKHPGLDVQLNVLDPGEARTEMNQGSDVSPEVVVPAALALLSFPPGGPNGRFFHRDGRALSFGHVTPWHGRLLLQPALAAASNALV